MEWSLQFMLIKCMGRAIIAIIRFYDYNSGTEEASNFKQKSSCFLELVRPLHW